MSHETDTHVIPRTASPWHGGERFASLLAAATVLIGAAGVVAWVFRLPGLVQPLEAFGPTRPWSALLAMLAGAGMLLLLRRARRTAQCVGVAGLCLTIGCALAGLTHRPMPLDEFLYARLPQFPAALLYGLALTTALQLGAYFAALLLLAGQRVRAPQLSVVGGIGAVMLSLASVLIVIQLAGFLEQTDTTTLLRGSLASLTVTVLLSLALFQRVAQYERRSMAPPAWAPVLAAVTGLLVMPILWHELRARAADPTHTPLPDLVLVLGLAVTTLLTVTLWLSRKIWREASTEGMQRMQRAIERSTDGVWELDLAQRRAHRSASLLRHLGYDPTAVNGPADGWTRLLHPDDAARVAEALDAHLTGRSRAYEVEYRVAAADGTWHTIVDRGRVIERSVDRAPARMLGISADITERARAERALEESEQRFRVIFDSTYQLQLLLDLDGTILEANRAAEELAGVEPGALRGRALWDPSWWRVPSGSSGGSDGATMLSLEERFARARGGDATRFETVLASSAGRPSTIDFTLKPMRDAEGGVVQVLAEGRDLTDRKRAEVSLREIGALTTMGQIAARVAHEINNPLAGIQNAFLLVRGAIPTEHPHYHFVEAIDREIARAAAVTRQLYETYRPDQSMEVASSVILAISDAVVFLEQVNRARDVRITTSVAKAPSLVPVPDALIRQTLYNLVQNAVDASPAHGTVHVTAVQDGDECVIRVSDEGPGIPAEIRDRIFEPFFSTKDRTVKTGSMGIGLSLVRQSVQAVGGQIAVRDRPEGGSEFEVRLPMTPIDTGVLR